MDVENMLFSMQSGFNHVSNEPLKLARLKVASLNLIDFNRSTLNVIKPNPIFFLQLLLQILGGFICSNFKIFLTELNIG